MARRRSRRRKNSYNDVVPQDMVVEDLSPRARKLVEGGVIDVDAIAGSGEHGRVTSGDILHAARVMEMEQSVPRIERAGEPVLDDSESATAVAPESDEPSPEVVEPVAEDPTWDSGTSTIAQVGGQPISVAPDPWNDYNGSSDGLSESALPGAEQSWGEAEANIAAIAEEAAEAAVEPEPEADIAPELIEASDIPDSVGDVAVADEFPAPEAVEVDGVVEPDGVAETAVQEEPTVPEVSATEVGSEEPLERELTAPATEAIADLVAAANEAVMTTAPQESLSGETPLSDDSPLTEQSHEAEPLVPASQGEEMMDFGTLESVDPESVWAEGAEDFAPWFLAHSRQLGDVLGLDAGLSDARQFTTKSATGVVGRDDAGEDVVVVSSKSATAEDSDLGRALGMAASSGAASVALVSAALDEDQLKALAWLNNQTKSGVKWYGIQMRVVRIADSPAAMMFDLVASPPTD